MTPAKILEILEQKFSLHMDRRTLLNYDKARLIPEPNRDASGIGGRRTDYPMETIEEAYASYTLLHGRYHSKVIDEMFGRGPILTFACVAQIRLLALNQDKIKDSHVVLVLPQFTKQKKYASEDDAIDIEIVQQLKAAFAGVWRKERNFARLKRLTP